MLPSDQARQRAEQIVASLASDQSLDARRELARHPELCGHPAALLELAHAEYCRRRDTDLDLSPLEFAARFPTIEAELAEALLLDQLLGHQFQWPRAGDTFLGFELRELLGWGAASRVFLARQVDLGHRQVVVKICPDAAREAQLLGRLQHPGIVPVHSVSCCERTGLSVICMPFLGRMTLQSIIPRLRATGHPDAAAAETDRKANSDRSRTTAESRPTAESRTTAELSAVRWRRRRWTDQVAELGLQLALALAYAHRQRVFHCDIKPANILLTRTGQPLLLDFHLAVDARTLETAFGGTRPYMAPEFLVCEREGRPPPPVEAAQDVFSLGATLYELLTGRLACGPVQVTRAPQELTQLLLSRYRAGIQPAARWNSSVDGRLDQLVRRCLSFEPTQRPEADEVAAVLDEYLRPSRRALRAVKRGRKRMLVSALVLSVGMGAFLPTDSGRNLLARFGVLPLPASRLGQQHFHAGRAAWEAGELDTAGAHFEQALRADPDHAAARLWRGLVALRQQRYREALDDLWQLDPEGRDPRVAAHRGHALTVLRDYDGAVAQYQRSLWREPNLHAVRHNLAYVLWMRSLSNADNRLADLRSAHRLLKHSPATESNWKSLYLESNIVEQLRYALLDKADLLRVTSTAKRTKEAVQESLQEEALELEDLPLRYARACVEQQRGYSQLFERLAYLLLMRNPEAGSADFDQATNALLSAAEVGSALHRIRSIAAIHPDIAKDPQLDQLLSSKEQNRIVAKELSLLIPIEDSLSGYQSSP